jgi:hypothetical protein
MEQVMQRIFLGSATIIPLTNMVAKERRFQLNDQRPSRAASIFFALTNFIPLTLHKKRIFKNQFHVGW